MRIFFRKINSWLLPIMTILFILEVFTFPFVINVTYSGRSENPDHILTYTTNKLKWDSNTNINPNGSAELSLFDMIYGEEVRSHNTDKVIAPGTDNTNIIRLRNASENKIQYTAVLYKKTTDEKVPVEVEMIDSNFTDTKTYYLPEELKDVEIVRAVKGTLIKNNIQDFDINWEWKFHVSNKQDLVDTMLGNRINLDEVYVGFYLVVTEDIDENPDDEDDKPSRPGRPGGSVIIITPPKDPEVPDVPDTPDVPDKPEQPDIPDVPDIPDKPDKPDTPDNPDIPEVPDVPDTPDVGDGKDIITPEVPKTGDMRLIEMYITLMIFSGIILVLMIIEKRMEKKKK